MSDTSSPGPLRVEIRDGVALLALHRPARANAYTRPMLLEMRRALADLADRQEVRALVVHAGHSRHFCAGADRDELDLRLPQEALDLLPRRVFQDLAGWPWPTVAAIRGAALGGGMEMALACDVRLAAPDAIFGFPETSLGLIPAAGGCLRAPRVLGESLAREMILFGRQLSAAEALTLGLVSRVVPAGSLLDEAVALAAQAAGRHPLATRLAKQALDLATPLGAASQFEGAAQAALYAIRRQDCASQAADPRNRSLQP